MNGAPVPGIDFMGATGTNFSATAGKVQLRNGASVVDLVGYGPTANTFEGLGPAPAGSNPLAVQRTPNGFDTNNNNLDFMALAPTPDSFNTVVPEPSVYMLLGVGLLFCGQRFLRRKRA